MPKERNEPKIVLEKDLLVKKFGDSLYIPLTKFFKKMGIKQNTIVKVILYDDGRLIIVPSKNR